MLNNQLSLSKKNIEEGIVILINKEKNWTSFDVVKKIKNLIKAKFDLKKIKVGNKTDYVLRPDYIKEFQLLEN